MKLLGFSLNMVSLLAITLSTGILVDDAIVEIENIVRHIQMGKSPYQAALEAADEIGLAVIAISLTIVAVFVPASFMPSIPGQFFKQFGITVSVQVLFSLLCARMITPMLAAYFLQPHQHEEKRDGRDHASIRALVDWAVRHRFITVAGRLRVCSRASLAVPRFLPSGFLPVTDNSRSMLAIELPPGSQLCRHRSSDRRSSSIGCASGRRWRACSSMADESRAAAVDVRKAALTINSCRNRSGRSRSRNSSRRSARNSRTFRTSGTGSSTKRTAKRHVHRHRRRITQRSPTSQPNSPPRCAGCPMVANVVSGATLNRPELRIYPRRDLAVRLGVSTESLSETIRVATIGDVGPGAGKIRCRRSTVPDPRPARGKGPRRSASARTNPRAVATRGGRAARRARRHKFWRGPDQHRSLRSPAPGQRRGGSWSAALRSAMRERPSKRCR